jgi:hypothetical protein
VLEGGNAACRGGALTGRPADVEGALGFEEGFTIGGVRSA